ncbi:unnamed protein product [Orchesella dallaii]|uniref:Uncharacterized protein n=1 Tax=Orchesella dallaii TaxID=48710 RepID=A0ABP1RMB1_9HEXA
MEPGQIDMSFLPSSLIFPDLKPETENEFYFKVENMVLDSCYFLRKLFHHRWTSETGRKWQPTIEQEQVEQLLSDLNSELNIEPIKDQILTECLDEWDMATLSFVLQNFGDQHPQEYGCLSDVVQKLKALRNDLSHHPSKSLKKEEYNTKVDKFRSIVKGLDVDEEEIEKTIRMAGVTDSIAAVKMMKALHDEAKQCLEKNEGAKGFERALKCFDKAISTPSLLRTQQASAFEKRAECYLQFARHQKDHQVPEWINLRNKAIQDASAALELNDESWNAHVIMVQAYRLKTNWEVPVKFKYVNETLSRCPSRQNVEQEVAEEKTGLKDYERKLEQEIEKMKKRKPVAVIIMEKEEELRIANEEVEENKKKYIDSVRSNNRKFGYLEKEAIELDLQQKALDLQMKQALDEFLVLENLFNVLGKDKK